jgi:hypothetical protein
MTSFRAFKNETACLGWYKLGCYILTDAVTLIFMENLGKALSKYDIIW